MVSFRVFGRGCMENNFFLFCRFYTDVEFSRRQLSFCTLIPDTRRFEFFIFQRYIRNINIIIITWFVYSRIARRIIFHESIRLFDATCRTTLRFRPQRFYPEFRDVDNCTRRQYTLL